MPDGSPTASYYELWPNGSTLSWTRFLPCQTTFEPQPEPSFCVCGSTRSYLGAHAETSFKKSLKTIDSTQKWTQNRSPKWGRTLRENRFWAFGDSSIPGCVPWVSPACFFGDPGCLQQAFWAVLGASWSPSRCPAPAFGLLLHAFCTVSQAFGAMSNCRLDCSFFVQLPIVPVSAKNQGRAKRGRRF